MQERPGDQLIGAVVGGRYDIQSRIARGGMSTVYLALDQRLDRRVALKVLYPHLAEDPTFLHRFEQEAKSAARLAHPHVVGVLDQGIDSTGGSPLAYLAMEYVPGTTLRGRLEERGRFTPRQALALMDPVIEGLAAAHEAGLVHRDVKPENVLLSTNGQIKIADFGLSRAASASTRTATLVGTVAYLSPELVSGEAAHAQSDIYSAGIMLYELLTGRQPFTAQTPIQVAFQHVHSSVPAPSTLLPGLPVDIDELVQWCTASDPEDRPVDGTALLGELRHIRTTLTDAELDYSPDDGVRAGAAPVSVGGVTEPPAAGSAAASYSTERVSSSEYPTTMISTAAGHTQVIGTRPGYEPQDSAGHALPTPPAAPGAPPQPSARKQRKARARDAQRPQKTLYGKNARRRRALWLVLLLALAALAAAAGWFFGSGPGGLVAVPDVANRPVSEAQQIFSATGLTSTATTEVFDDTVGNGMVIGTDPGPDTEVRRFEEVVLLVSKGPELFTVPGVVGESLKSASAALQRAELETGTVGKEFSDTVEAGLVIRQNPAPGVQARSGTRVELAVSRGPEPITVPEVIGAPREKAVQAIEAAGLTAKILPEGIHSPNIPEGAVAGQSPTSGTLNRGGTVTVTLSVGPRIVEVPNVFSKPEADAVKALEAAGFAVVVDYTFGSSVLGLVAGQDLTGKHPEGSTVTLTVT